MADFLSAVTAHKDLPLDKQKQAGQAIAGKMGDEHESFMQLIVRMLDNKEIDVRNPQSFLKEDVYNALSDEWKAKVDVELINITDMLRHIVDFRLSKGTPDESPQLQSMIEQLWQMKQRIEETHDVFKF